MADEQSFPPESSDSTPLPALLQLVQALTSALPLTQARVESQLEVVLKPLPLQNNPAFTLLEGGHCFHDQIHRVELRLPNQNTHRLDGLLILSIAPTVEVSFSEVTQAFGAIYSLLMPHPRQPADAPMTYRFALAWGELRVGFSRDGADRLKTLVLDVNR